MKKEIYHYPIVFLIIPVVISILGIFFGSFFDLNLSKGIVNTASSMGAFIESFGLVIPFCLLPLSGVLVMKGLWPKEKLWIKITGIVFLVMTCLIGIYCSAKHLIGATDIKEYGIVYKPIIGYLISAIIIFLSFLFFFYFIKDNENTTEMVILGLIIVFVMLSQALFINIFKQFNCRPRYRFLIDDEINTSQEVFRSWWEFKPFSNSNDYHKSWPSGHTGTASVMLLLPLIHRHLRFPFKNAKYVLYAIGLFYALFVAIYRIIFGAHFLSDVSFGLLFASLIIIIYLFATNKITNKINRKVEA